jgi:tetratricopeptide (TPR) repeat protein
VLCLEWKEEEEKPNRKPAEFEPIAAQGACNIGHFYYDQGDMEKALVYYWQALLMYQVVGDRWSKSSIYDYISQAYEHTGQLEKAIHYMTRCVRLGKKLGHPYLKRESTQFLGQLFRLG